MSRSLAVLLCCLSGTTLCAADPATGARLNNLKVLSDKIDDVTTVENILKSFTRPGMADADRAKGIWTAVVKYRHQTTPPNEQLAADWEAHDPVKIFNVYGYCMCCCCSALIEGLNRADGREARGRILTGHSVPEVFYDGAWHMYDSSLITYFPKPGNGALASVDEMAEQITRWYAQNPDYRQNESRLRALMRENDGTGWKKGPELLSLCPFYKQGWFPARTHGWYSTMLEYDRQSGVYEYGYHLGHKALFSLRPGESFLREAGNRGLHINGTSTWRVLKAQAPRGDLVYLKDFFPGYNGGVVGNGVHRYAPDLAAGGLAAGAEVYENLTVGGDGALRPRDPARPGVVVVPMLSPYVYLGGRLKLKAIKRSAADQIVVSLSTNNARSFTPIWTADRTGEQTLDLTSQILRRYAYWLKIEIVSTSAEGAGLEALLLENDFQHAPRTLPWLGRGTNTITVAADSDADLATRSVVCRITSDANFQKNESTSSLGVVFDNLDVQNGSCWWKGGVGRMTVPIQTPGALVALRFGAQIRAGGDTDAVRMVLSFDEGRTWKPAAQIVGPTAGRTEYFRFTDIPSGAKQALLRYELTGQNTLGIFSFRVDAEYRDPSAAKTFRPFAVVHRWRENGQEKTHREVVPRLPYQYPIEVGQAPEMVAVSYEMPAR